MPNEKVAITVDLSPEAHKILKETAERLGVSRTAVLELSLREYAAARGRYSTPRQNAGGALRGGTE